MPPGPLVWGAFGAPNFHAVNTFKTLRYAPLYGTYNTNGSKLEKLKGLEKTNLETNMRNFSTFLKFLITILMNCR